jgi:hypothetical protein
MQHWVELGRAFHVPREWRRLVAFAPVALSGACALEADRYSLGQGGGSSPNPSHAGSEQGATEPAGDIPGTSGTAGYGTKNACSSNQCACDAPGLACGAKLPRCTSWDFDSETVEGWKVGSYYPADQHGMTTGVSTVVSNGSPVLTAKYDHAKGRAAEFSVDLCPDAGILDLSNYVFKYDLYLRTTAGSRFSRDEMVADTFLANGGKVLTACQPFLAPASDTWEAASCGSLPSLITNMTIIVRFSQAWAGDIYIDNPRFELRSAQ